MKFTIKFITLNIALLMLLGSCMNAVAQQVESKNSINNNGPEKMDIGEKAFQNGEYKRAIEIYKDIIEENNPNTIYKASYNLAYCYYRLSDFTLTKKTLKTTLAIDIRNPEYNWFRYNSFFMLGRVAWKENDSRLSLEYLEKALLYRQTADLYVTIALKETELGKYEQALSHVNKAINLQNNNSNLFSTRASVYLKMNEINSAMLDISKAISLDSLNPYSFRHRATANIALKDYANMCTDLKKADELDYRKYASKKETQELDSLLKAFCK